MSSTVGQLLKLCWFLQIRWFGDSRGLGESCAEAAEVILPLMNGAVVKCYSFLGRWLTTEL